MTREKRERKQPSVNSTAVEENCNCDFRGRKKFFPFFLFSLAPLTHFLLSTSAFRHAS